MQLNHLSDRALLADTKNLADAERGLLTKVIHHLREIDRRRLYSDLGYGSLFEYAVKELQYSEGQAGRRLQAMRMIKEIPEVEEKIGSGELNLSNVAQAQSFFRELAKGASPTMPVLTKSMKIEILQKLENKSTREAQRELSKLAPEAAMPRERQRIISEDCVEIKFVADRDLAAKLDEVRALAGPKGATMGMADLFAYMAELAAQALRVKKFGKKGAAEMAAQPAAVACAPAAPAITTPELTAVRPSRHIPNSTKRFIYQRDAHQCVACGSKHNLNIDHIVPLAGSGQSVAGNLRLLCFNCNQRAAMKVLGLEFMEAKRRRS